MLGSKQRLQRALASADPVDIANQGVAARYRTRRVRQVAADNTPMSAYEIAKAGGAHAGLVRRYKDDTDYALNKGIKSLKARIEEHRQKITDPRAYVDPDATGDELRYLIKSKWPKEMARFAEELSVLEGLLKERGNG